MPDRRPPLTVSRAPLLKDGSDAAFRTLLYDFLTVAARMQAVRDRFAAGLGVTGPQYSILMAVAHRQGDRGVSVRDVAEHLHVTGAFVTAETGKLAAAGLLEKRSNPADRRGVLLTLSDAAWQRIEALAPDIRRTNDIFFGSLDPAGFDTLRGIVDRMVPEADDALSYITSLAEDRARRLA